ncbi:unnamed protein product [Protopolystoma xenopodis]|uniref:Uncharacterized protein n=1 Tax=Protopolystoma xenopodis TaxID=117903 RepID=A0A3S5BUN1_9PLAT|nr:unnamed protein product [Protopolystoma xenopodis]
MTRWSLQRIQMTSSTAPVSHSLDGCHRKHDCPLLSQKLFLSRHQWTAVSTSHRSHQHPQRDSNRSHPGSSGLQFRPRIGLINTLSGIRTATVEDGSLTR